MEIDLHDQDKYFSENSVSPQPQQKRRPWENKYSEGLQLSTADQLILEKFVESARLRADNHGVLDNDWKIQTVASDANIQLSSLSKNLFVGVWIEFLDLMKSYIPESFFKYQTLDNFLEAYPKSSFSIYPKDEQIRLMETANWMNILFKMEKAKKNKGLVMEVIPKLVEGPLARYVTGSGQTHATADRVMIYENEGSVSPVIRGKRRKLKHMAGSDVGVPFQSKKKGSGKLKSKDKQRMLKRQGLSSRPRRIESQNGFPLATSNTSELVQSYFACSSMESGTNDCNSATFPADSVLSRQSSSFSLPDMDAPADTGFVTWSVDLNNFHSLQQTTSHPKEEEQLVIAAPQPIGLMDSIAVDFTDGAEDSDDHDVDTASITESPAEKWGGEEVREEPVRWDPLETLPDYWDGLNNQTTIENTINNANLSKSCGEQEMPSLWRQQTDRPALLKLLEEVGGSSNPVQLDADLQPNIFNRGITLSPPRPKAVKRARPNPERPKMYREVSWGGAPRLPEELSLPAFPAPHKSYKSEIALDE